MNLRRTLYKLQTALNMRGRRIKINQHQAWSQTQNRMITKYVIQEPRIVKGREKYVTIFESHKAADVVKLLAGMMEEQNETGT